MRTSGYQDALQGRTVPYWGTLRQLLVALLAALAAVLAEMTSLSAAEIDVSWRARVVAFLVWATPSALAVAIGVRLGQTVGLGAPVVRGWVVGEANLGRRIQSLLPATLVGGIGVINGMALHLAGPWFEKHLWPDMPENARRAVEAASHTPGWKMILASFAGGVCEGLVFRFGLMTLIVCLGTKLAGLAAGNRNALDSHPSGRGALCPGAPGQRRRPGDSGDLRAGHHHPGFERRGGAGVRLAVKQRRGARIRIVAFTAYEE